MSKTATKFLGKYWAIIAILLLAFFLRSYNYVHRVAMSYDQGRDAAISLYAVQNHKLPLLGPPSSAWGMNFGPLYYYFAMISVIAFQGNLAPWIGFTFLSLLSVYLYYLIGSSVDKKLGLALSLVAAISLGEVSNSANLSNILLVPIGTILVFYALSILTRKSSIWASIILGIGIGIAINGHLQSLGLLIFIPGSFLILHDKIRTKIIHLFVQLFGLILTLVPLIIFELQHQFAYVKSLLDYAINGQKKFYIPVRWLTDITQFWPQLLGKIVTGIPSSGYIIIALAILVTKRRRVNKFFLLLTVGFITQIILIRYYKGPRSPEYMLIVYPYALIFTSWAIKTIYDSKKIIGVSLICLLSIACFSRLPQELKGNSAYPSILSIKNEIETRLAGKVALGSILGSGEINSALYYLLSKDNRVDDNSSQIITVCDNIKPPFIRCPNIPKLIDNGKYVIYLNSATQSAVLREYNYEIITDEKLYKRLYNNYEVNKY